MMTLPQQIPAEHHNPAKNGGLQRALANANQCGRWRERQEADERNGRGNIASHHQPCRIRPAACCKCQHEQGSRCQQVPDHAAEVMYQLRRAWHCGAAAEITGKYRRNEVARCIDGKSKQSEHDTGRSREHPQRTGTESQHQQAGWQETAKSNPQFSRRAGSTKFAHKLGNVAIPRRERCSKHGQHDNCNEGRHRRTDQHCAHCLR